MDYGEAYRTLEEITEKDPYQEIKDETGVTASVTPDVELVDDRAVLYVQIANVAKDEYERKVLGEYQDGELTSTDLTEIELDAILSGTGEIEIDQSVLEKEANTT